MVDGVGRSNSLSSACAYLLPSLPPACPHATLGLPYPPATVLSCVLLLWGQAGAMFITPGCQNRARERRGQWSRGCMEGNGGNRLQRGYGKLQKQLWRRVSRSCGYGPNPRQQLEAKPQLPTPTLVLISEMRGFSPNLFPPNRWKTLSQNQVNTVNTKF